MAQIRSAQRSNPSFWALARLRPNGFWEISQTTLGGHPKFFFLTNKGIINHMMVTNLFYHKPRCDFFKASNVLNFHLQMRDMWTCYKHLISIILISKPNRPSNSKEGGLHRAWTFSFIPLRSNFIKNNLHFQTSNIFNINVCFFFVFLK